MIVVYATTNGDDGFCEKIGEYESIEDVRIRIGMFADDVVITFCEEEEAGVKE